MTMRALTSHLGESCGELNGRELCKEELDGEELCEEELDGGELGCHIRRCAQPVFTLNAVWRPIGCHRSKRSQGDNCDGMAVMMLWPSV